MNNRIGRRIDIFTAYQAKRSTDILWQMYSTQIENTTDNGTRHTQREDCFLIKQIILSYLLSKSFSLCPLVSLIEDPGNFSHFSGFGH